MVAWCVVALALVAWSVSAGVRPSWSALLLVAGMVPLGVASTLVGFRAEPRTAAQVLHEIDRAPRQG
jgi:hypothetical protein